MPDVESLLEDLESEDPRPAIREAKSLLETDDLSDDDRSRLTYGIAAGYFKIGIFGDALDWIDETESDRKWLLKGFCHMNLNQPEQARTAFLNSARKGSENTKEALLLAAQCLAAMENYEAASNEFKTLLKQEISDRQQAEINYNLGLIYEETDELEKASSRFEAILEEVPGEDFEDEALFHLALIYEEKGQIQTALEQVEKLESRVEQNSEDAETVAKLKNRLRNQEKSRTEQLRDYDF